MRAVEKGDEVMGGRVTLRPEHELHYIKAMRGEDSVPK